jgi:hypothetical protein
MPGADRKGHPIRVCNQALLQFIERVGGLDTEGLRRHLQDSLQRALAAADSVGSSEFVIVADGVKYDVVNGVVVTVHGKRPAPKRKARHR